MFSKAAAVASEPGTLEESLQFDGTTIFAPPPSPTYRYSLLLKNDKLRIWLEDNQSKAQWCTTPLSLSDYIDSSNSISNATASDYTKYFHQLLDAARTDANDFPITLQRLKGGVFRLEVAEKFQVLMQPQVATYSFHLEPISLERVDILESKMRDVREKVDSLRDGKEDIVTSLQKETKRMSEEIIRLINKVKELEDQEVVTIRKSSDTKEDDWIVWGSETTIPVTIPGTYQVTAVVSYESGATNALIELWKNDTCIQSVYSGAECGDVYYCGTATIMEVTKVEENDTFSVKCPHDLVGECHLMLVRIGK